MFRLLGMHDKIFMIKKKKKNYPSFCELGAKLCYAVYWDGSTSCFDSPKPEKACITKTSRSIMFTSRFIYSIVLVCSLCGARLVKSSVPHENFPSFDSMFAMPTTRSKDTVSTAAAQPTLSTTNTAGLVYMEFYADSICGGSVTFSSGFRADYCLPANDYIRPPFSDEDDYYYSFPFQSMKLSNVTESCDSWAITYYTDKLCTTVYSTYREPANYTDCRLWTNQPVSNLVSAKGKCSLSSRAPVQATSYLVRY